MVVCFNVREAFQIKRIVALLALVLMLPASCGLAEVKRYEASFMDVFDTYSQIIIYSDNKNAAQSAAQAAYAELKTCHRLYDIYNSYEGISNLKTVNDSAGKAAVSVDERIIAMLLYAKEMYALTDGRINVAMGAVLRLWHDSRTAGITSPETAALPDMEALRLAAEHTDIENVVIDIEAGTVYLADTAMSLDVGALAKGYATERAAQLLEQYGVTSALLSIGGNVRAIGVKRDGSTWQSGVQNPDLEAGDQNLMVVGLRDMSLVSSGGYQRFYIVDGKRYHHIIDPVTLMPAEAFGGVSVLTRDAALADALSTALFVAPLEEGMALIESMDGVEALWVLADGTLVKSEGFDALAGGQQSK